VAQGFEIEAGAGGGIMNATSRRPPAVQTVLPQSPAALGNSPDAASVLSKAHAGRAAGRGLAAWALKRLLTARLQSGTLTLVTPTGKTFTNAAAVPGPHGELVLRSWRALRRLLTGGDLGFAEAYVDGDWDSPDLAAFIEFAARNVHVAEANSQGTFISRLRSRMGHARRANTKPGARRNIEAHYDLGNEFYATWLDAGMTYSSALYETPTSSLEHAQAAKQTRVLDLLRAPTGGRVLEIGCGWGGLAERLARAGAHVTGITLSPSQLAIAAPRVAGLPAEMRLQDYRDVTGVFDRVVSIEMLEAVGAAYWPDFFARLNARLAPGGCAVLQVISIAEDRFATYLARPDFIQRHIFPGGMLPTIPIIRAEIERAGLKLNAMECFGQSYAATLAEWHTRFEAAWDTLRTQGFDEHFYRKWKYYLQYCEGGFRAGAIDVGLYTITKSA
jgi:cyclopropane-fatty-acyl-phospholipid synthase